MASRPVDRGLRGLPAEQVDSFDAWDVQDRLVRAIGDILERADVEFVRLTRSGQEWLVVDARRQEDAARAILASSSSRYWIAEDLERPRPKPRPLSSILPTTGSRAFRVYRHLRSPSGRYVGSREAGVFLEFWRATARGTKRPDGGVHVTHTLRPRVRNRVAPYLAPTQWKEAQALPGHRLAAQGQPNLLDFTEPVDAVYTWVDDSDEARRAQRDRDAFRYSLRSLAMYAGWVRHIWIVTDGQAPAWLDVDHPRVSVVTHREIFADLAALPVFKPHAIESRLHHIPGLAEHFLYLNDDLFFGRPVRPELFFHGNGLPKVMNSTIAIDFDVDADERDGAMLVSRQSRAWIQRTFSRTITHRVQHMPHALLKSVVTELEALMPAEFARIARSRFRHGDDLSIPSELAHHFAYATRRAVTGALSYQYVDVGSPLAAEHMRALLDGHRADCFCVNNVTGGSAVGAHDRLRRFLTEYFPLASPFERTVK